MDRIIEFEHRMTEVEDRSKSNTKRLDKIENVTKEIHTLSTTMVKLVEQTKATDENVHEIKEKVEAIEKEPADDFKHIKRTIITSVITAVVGAIIGALLGLVIKGSI